MNLEHVSLDIDLDYYKKLSTKHCPTVYDEINEYQPQNVSLPPTELIIFRQTKGHKNKGGNKGQSYKEEKNPSLLVEKEFFAQQHIKDYLEEKWQIELYNHNCFLRLYELLQINENKEYEAVLLKLNLFHQHILQMDHLYSALRIDFKKFNIPKPILQEADWTE